ncbi:hypothetical protein K2173_011015 [Erythroxylum novogranatense]|uniref:Bromo domain-containing protein n=1 Tax=Erythroxylum novogranatense TaxID=1862640 RepID=A0AAV8T1A7_9ROSI|nr:hypothetical protein K2173_011015 [Erythroxylum novogranatense]
MARREHTIDDDDKAAQGVSGERQWGALEELLLACAVNRHGTESWDSVAVEVKDRTPSLGGLTSENCMDKFKDLQRRYINVGDGANRLVDELRRIRVEELRREVQQRDDSIVSLELKVKRLKEEREGSVKGDIDLKAEKIDTPTTMIDAGDERDDRSFNESNSTSQQQKVETTINNEANDIVTSEVVIKLEPESDPTRPQSEPGWSHDNGATRASQAGGVGDSNELGESVGESKREEKDKNSDVQSSATLSLKKKKRGRRPGGGGGSSAVVGSSSGDEVSPATKRVSVVKSEPLIKILEIIRSNRLSSAFERRLWSQESERYKNLVRQHIDLQTVQLRLDKGAYSNAVGKFFRDLLLLLSNSIVFFRKNSPEHLAAVELRSLVLKQKAEMFPKLETSKEVVKVEPELKTALVSKPAMVVCTAKGNVRAQPENASKKVDQKEVVVEERSMVKEEKIEAAPREIKEKGMKNRSKERSVSVPGRRSSRTESKSNGEMQHQYGGNELSSHDNFDVKVEKKVDNQRKRQGAASFLKRMKKNSPNKLTQNDDDSSSEEEESKGSKGKGDRKTRGRDRDKVRETVTRSSRGRGVREVVGKKKRIGRPPKRRSKTALESSGERGKRGRDGVDAQVGGGGTGRGRKKTRR